MIFRGLKQRKYVELSQIDRRAIKGAEVKTCVTGRVSQRVVVQTQADDILLISVTTSDLETLETMTSKIESFIHQPQQTYLKVTQDERIAGFQLGVCFGLLGSIVAVLVARAENSW